MGTQETASAGLSEDAHTSFAFRWVGESVIAGIVASIINAMVLSGGPGAGAFVIALLVNIGLACFIAVRLFLHVDSLILQRISETGGGGR